MAHSSNTISAYSWLLSGETIQAAYDSIDLSLGNTLREGKPDSFVNGMMPYNPSSATMGPGPSMSDSLSYFNFTHSAKKTKSQSANGPLASLLTAAGNTFQGRNSQEHPYELPQYYNQHNTHHGHLRSLTHPHQDQISKHSTTSPAQSSRFSQGQLPSKRYRVVITNFRVCSLQYISDGHSMIQLQVAIGAIATITLQEHHKIDITVNFDSPQYTILQLPHGKSVISEVLSNLSHLVYYTETRLRFPYKMGLSMIDEESNSNEKTKKDYHASLWTGEEIFALSDKTHNNKMTEDRSGSKAEDHHLQRILGWTDAYNIFDEYKRLKFDESLWSVANLNEDFELSPTYPERFIMPNSFLDTPIAAHSQQSSAFNMAQLSNSSACIKQLAAYRASKRFPLVCWKTPEAGLVLMRSSQPMVGFRGTRGAEDELYIRTVLNTAANESRRSNHTPKIAPKLCIIDARAYTSAVANVYKGGGRENPDHYPNAKIFFMSLGNIHDIAKSHKALLKAVSTQSESSNWFTLVESTGWLTHVTDILRAASGREGVVGRMLEEDCSVLVHCTDGWDRTSQLVSLAQIILDPYYRTIQGLRVLIEKEWLSCGHPFQARTDASSNQKKTNLTMDDEPLDYRRSSTAIIHSSPNGARESISVTRKLDAKTIPPFSYHVEPESLFSNRATTTHENHSAYAPSSSPPSQQSKNVPVQTIPSSPSPVFLLFLTCLHHIVQQHPRQFEYNDYLLVVLARAAAGSSPFGDFLYNNECERAQDRMRQRTPSIWKWIQENQGWFKNRNYVPEPKHRSKTKAGNPWREQVLQVQTGGRFISIWSEYYFNSTPELFPDPRTVLSSALFHFRDRDQALLMSLRRQVGLFTDPWHSSQFDLEQLQKMTYPGLHPSSETLYDHQASNDEDSKVTDLKTIPPALAQLSGQDMHLYYLLVQHLRERRKRQVKQAFLRWRSWTARRLVNRPAREAGWVVDGISAASSQDGSAPDHDDSDDGNAMPKLKVTARKGIESAMVRVLEDETFFGKEITAFESESEEEDENEGEMIGGEADGQMGESQDSLIDMEALDDCLEEAFDDFGFPVSTGDKIKIK
ncbi:Myotubularin- protein 3 [Haplosporangium sp. Z 27]|nr:Myotubularin- protein 3 [Haplosporangium sp. Z 27]